MSLAVWVALAHPALGFVNKYADPDWDPWSSSRQAPTATVSPLHGHRSTEPVVSSPVGGGEFGGFGGVGPPGAGLCEQVCRSGAVPVVVVLVGAHHHGAAVHRRRSTEQVASSPVGSGELGSLAPHPVLPDENVGRPGIRIAAHIVLGGAHYHGVAVHRHRAPKLVVSNRVGGGEFGFQGLEILVASNRTVAGVVPAEGD